MDQNTQFDEEMDMDQAILTGRLGGLMEVLLELDMDSELHMDGEGMPYLLAKREDEVYRFFYIIADDEEEAFILQISRILRLEEGDALSAMDHILSCETFNMQSAFGFAVYYTDDNVVELRAQTIEYGGLSEVKEYAVMMDLFMLAAEDLEDMLRKES